MIETKALTLIRTKLQRPRMPKDLILRRRLLDELHAGSEGKLKGGSGPWAIFLLGVRGGLFEMGAGSGGPSTIQTTRPGDTQG